MRNLMKSLLKKLRPYWPEWTVVFCILLVFGYSLTFDFQLNWDDSYYVAHNRNLAFTLDNIVMYWKHGMLGLWTPLTMMSLMLDNLIWGNSCAFGFRLTNLLLHAGTALLFIRVLRTFGIRPVLVFLAALVWAVYPQRMESVIWIAERKDVLSGILAMGSLYAFIHAYDRKRFPLTAFMLYGLAICAKPSPIGLPVFFFLYAAWKNPECIRWRRVAGVVLLMAAAVAGIASVMHFVPDFEPLPRAVQVIFHNLCFYAVNSGIPLYVNPCYPLLDWSTWPVVPLAALIIACYVFYSRRAGLSWKWICGAAGVWCIAYLASIMTCTGGFKFNPVDFADRYSYLPGLVVWGFFAGFSEVIVRRKISWKRPLIQLYVILLVAALFQTLWHIRFWKDSRTMIRWCVYSPEFPNDKVVLIHAAHGILDRDPGVLEESIRILEAKSEKKDLPRDTDRIRQARIRTAGIFRICLNILNGEFNEAKAALDKIPEKPENMLLLDKRAYEGPFKDLALRMLILTDDEERMDRFMTWAPVIIDPKAEGGERQNHYLVFLYLYAKKDYKGAMAALKREIAEKGMSPEMEKNLRMTGDALKNSGENGGESAP